ncbi:hypothetical protein DXG01_001524 [Tephrocybe rancida]|nr:hypothetical protein DXG01_001524 [Tephrocybe rancida]
MASSLQHIASSATFPNRGSSSSGYGPQAEGEPHSGSIFRVSVPVDGVAARGIGQPRPHRSNFIIASHKPDDSNSRSPTSSRPGYSAGIISFPAGPIVGAQSSRARSPDDPDAVSDGDLSGSNNGKKHSTTYLLGSAFRCPWPNCAREFNVNSNMRRHYRNHTTPGVSRPHAVDNGRRRKRGTHSLVFVPGDPRAGSHSANSFSPPPISSLSMDEGSDGSDGGNYQDDEEDELDSLPDDASPIYPTSAQPWARQNEFSDKDHYDSRHSASSSSSSPSPPLRPTYTYSPSAPYSRSFADSKVSTALRPAFHSKPVSAVTPGEPMSEIR